MFYILFFVSVVGFLSGIRLIADTVVWKICAGEDFVRFGEYYAQTRHRFFFHEISTGIFFVLVSIIILLFALRYIKRCSHCKTFTIKKQNFCHKCGNKLKKNA